jgi:glycine oxidase
MPSPDILIIGGGIIGLSLAHKLATASQSVLLLDRQQPGQEASWAAAGMLSPDPESPEDEALLPLAKKSVSLYPDFIAAIENASGLSTNYRRDGALELFFGRTAESDRDRTIAAHRKYSLASQSVSAGDARAIEPSLTKSDFSAVWLSDECSVSPRALTAAVLKAAESSGAEIRANIEVRNLRIENSHCTGAESASEKFSAKHVILAAGAFSSQINPSAIAPTRPARGQMLALRPERPVPNRVLRSHNGYVVPRGNGLVVAGSTIENAGFEKRVTAAGISSILSAAIALVPELATAAIEETWSGLRPDTPDHLPIIGLSEFEGLWLATGHYRNGIMLAPATAKILSDWILQGNPNFEVESYSPHRLRPSAAASRS